MDIAFGEAARAKSAETPFDIAVQQCFGQDRACAVYCAAEQHIINLVGHQLLLIAVMSAPERSIFRSSLGECLSGVSIPVTQQHATSTSNGSHSSGLP